jgi:hypothetical protein
LTVVVANQYRDLLPGGNAGFSNGVAGGIFSYSNPVVSNGSRTGAQFDTVPANSSQIRICASATRVTNPAVFTETAQ